MTPSVSIFYVTFSRDRDFHIYSLRSIEKYTTGFHEVVMCVPNPDVASFESLRPLIKKYPYKVIGYDEIPGKGMVQHEAIIMQSEQYCSGDFILHMDSDCVFWEPASPEDYFVDGKPVCYREPYERFRHYGGRFSWKECVKNAIGIDPEFETMCRHPMLYPRWLYPLVRDAVRNHTGIECYDYFCMGKNDWPQSVAEHDTLGAYAIANHPEAFQWVEWETNTSDHGYHYDRKRDKVVAFWSHGGVDRYLTELERIVPSEHVKS